MVTFGLDLSHHQDLGLDLARARREGIEFVFLKATEGATFVDSEFAANLAEARAAGQLVAAYHYVRSNAGASAQVAHIQKVIPTSVPVIPDVEANSGAIGLTRDLVDRLRAAGYTVPLLYLPRWYWTQIGSPSLAGLPPLWSSRYPDNTIGTISDEWADVPATYWTGYGGLDVAVLQFTSSAAIAGHQPLDANAYRGTRAQLAALLGGGVEDDMTPEQDNMLRSVYAAMFMRWDPAAKTHVLTNPTQGDQSLINRLAELQVNARTLVGRPAADVDELALAAALAPLLPDMVGDLSDDDLARIATAVADEHARRQAA